VGSENRWVWRGFLRCPLPAKMAINRRHRPPDSTGQPTSARRSRGHHYTAEKRDARKEQPISAEDWLIECANRDPGPEEAAAFVDQIESLLQPSTTLCKSC